VTPCRLIERYQVLEEPADIIFRVEAEGSTETMVCVQAPLEASA
jgi:hypothetical protein